MGGKLCGRPIWMVSKVVALHYGFLDGAGFSTALAELQEAGALTVGLCVGTAAWNSLAGSPKSMLSNVVNAHQGFIPGSLEKMIFSADFG